MFAFATVLSLFYPRHGLWAYPLAMLVAYSRLYVAAHWPTDILPSLAMGVLVGLLVTNVVQRLISKPTPSTRSAVE
jgi:undecaprenyl-diphosphatase